MHPKFSVYLMLCLCLRSLFNRFHLIASISQYIHCRLPVNMHAKTLKFLNSLPTIPLSFLLSLIPSVRSFIRPLATPKTISCRWQFMRFSFFGTNELCVSVSRQKNNKIERSQQHKHDSHANRHRETETEKERGRDSEREIDQPGILCGRKAKNSFT